VNLNQLIERAIQFRDELSRIPNAVDKEVDQMHVTLTNDGEGFRLSENKAGLGLGFEWRVDNTDG